MELDLALGLCLVHVVLCGSKMETVLGLLFLLVLILLVLYKGPTLISSGPNRPAGLDLKLPGPDWTSSDY